MYCICLSYVGNESKMYHILRKHCVLVNALKKKKSNRNKKEMYK